LAIDLQAMYGGLDEAFASGERALALAHALENWNCVVKSLAISDWPPGRGYPSTGDAHSCTYS